MPVDLDLDTDAGDGTLASEASYTLARVSGRPHRGGVGGPGWSLTNLVCTGAGADSSTALATRTATLDIDSGEDVVCTFTNTKGASLKVVKVTDPASDPQDFDFDLTGAGVPTDLDLDTDPGSAGTPSEQTFPFNAAQLGAHTVTESVLAGLGPDESRLHRRRRGLVDEPGEPPGDARHRRRRDVVCTFTNTKRAELEIVKATVPAAFDNDFAFGITGATASDFDADGSFSLNAKDAASDSQKAFVRAGSYSATETVPGGWTLTSIACLNGANADGNSTNASGSGGVGPAARSTSALARAWSARSRTPRMRR